MSSLLPSFWKFTEKLDDRETNEFELARLRSRVHELERAERRHVEESQQLIQNNALLHAIIDNIPFALSLKDTSHRYLMANQAFLESIGWDMQDLAGKPTGEVFPTDWALSAEADDRQVLSTGSTITR